MLRHLIALARQSGIARFEADVLTGNKPMRAVFERCGLPVQEARDGGVGHLTLALSDPL